MSPNRFYMLFECKKTIESGRRRGRGRRRGGEWIDNGGSIGACGDSRIVGGYGKETKKTKRKRKGRRKRERNEGKRIKKKVVW